MFALDEEEPLVNERDGHREEEAKEEAGRGDETGIAVGREELEAKKHETKLGTKSASQAVLPRYRRTQREIKVRETATKW